MSKEDLQLQVLMLSGGTGQRIKPITGQAIHKSELLVGPEITANEVFVKQLDEAGLKAIFSADNYYAQIAERIKGTSHEMIWQKPSGQIEAVMQLNRKLLVMAPDCLMDMRDVKPMLKAHKPGTVTWAVTRHHLPFMDEYIGADVDENGAITGRNDLTFVRSAMLIIEPDILRPHIMEGDYDLYYHLLPRLEAYNKERIEQGLPSVLNAFELSGPVLDIGTPQRWELARMILDKIVRLQ